MTPAAAAGAVAVREGSTTDVPPRRRELPVWWLGGCVMALLVASDYRFRTRDTTAALQGGADAAILIEIATYGMVAVVVYLASLRPAATRIRFRLLPLLWAAAGILVLSIAYSPYGLFSVVRGAQLVVVAWLAHVAATRATQAHFASFVRLFTVAVAASVVLGMLVPFQRTGAASGRFTWLHVHPVIAAVYLALAVLFLLCHLSRRADQRDAFAWPAPMQWLLLVVCVGGLLANQTRGAIIAVVIGSVVALWSRSSRGGRVDLAIASVVGLALTALVAGDDVVAFFQRGESVERIATLNSRTGLWSRMIELWADQPLIGYGLGASRGLLLEETGLGGAHNALINLMLDAGIIGVVVWILFLAAVVRYLLTLRRQPASRVVASTLLGAIVLLLVNGLTVEFLVVPATVASTWLFMIAAWTVVLVREVAAEADDDAQMPAVEAGGSVEDPVAPDTHLDDAPAVVEREPAVAVMEPAAVVQREPESVVEAEPAPAPVVEMSPAPAPAPEVGAPVAAAVEDRQSVEEHTAAARARAAAWAASLRAETTAHPARVGAGDPAEPADRAAARAPSATAGAQVPAARAVPPGTGHNGHPAGSGAWVTTPCWKPCCWSGGRGTGRSTRSPEGHKPAR